MKSCTRLARTLILTLVLLMVATSTTSAKSGGGHQTGLQVWRGEDLAGFTTTNVTRSSGNLTLNLQTAASETDPYAMGAYYGHNFYNGGSFKVGEATSPELPTEFGFKEAIASWNATTPQGTWVEVLLRAKVSGRWTKWYNMGVWASHDTTIERHSVRLQGDADAYVAVDTLVLAAKKVAATALQLKVRLFSADIVAIPTVTLLAVTYSTAAPKNAVASTGNAESWNTVLNVPECSQMVYPDGGNVWCSPTSTSMILGAHSRTPAACEPRVRAAVEGVYDWLYDGHGNWPFNTAYGANVSRNASYVARYTSFAEVEEWVKKGVPVAFSFAWTKGKLTGAAIPSSGGHLAVIVGFDVKGDVIVNDPAAAVDGEVQRTYLRSELEPLWLESSGGTVYIIE